MNSLNPISIYNTNHYEPLTPQTLPFDTYSPSSLSKPINNAKNINQFIPSRTNVIMNTSQPTSTYLPSSMNKPSSSTLVNLLHQKRPELMDQSVTHTTLPKDKQNQSVKQTRKSSQRKTQTKRLSTTNNNIQVNLSQAFAFLNEYLFL